MYFIKFAIVELYDVAMGGCCVMKAKGKIGVQNIKLPEFLAKLGVVFSKS